MLNQLIWLSLKTKDILLKTKDSLLKTKDILLKTKDSLLKTEDILLKTKDGPCVNRKFANTHPDKCTHPPTHRHPSWTIRISSAFGELKNQSHFDQIYPHKYAYKTVAA